MATEYEYNGHGGSDLGTLADPYTSMQSACTNHTTGNDIKCYDGGSGETLSSAVLLDQESGSEATKSHFIATNSSFVEDGTRYELDGNATASYCLSTAGYDSYWFTGFDFTDASSYGVYMNSSKYFIFEDCNFHANGDDGTYHNSSVRNVYDLCKFYNNTDRGAYTFSGGDNTFSFCIANGNGAGGWRLNDGNRMFRCISYDNSYGVLSGQRGWIYGCVCDDNTNSGFYVSNIINQISYSISTNNGTWGLQITGSGFVLSTGMAYYSNTSGEVSDSAKRLELIDDTTLSGDPYNDQASRDYTLSLPSPQLVGIERDLDGTNKSYETYGLFPPFSDGGGNIIGGSIVQ